MCLICDTILLLGLESLTHFKKKLWRPVEAYTDAQKTSYRGVHSTIKGPISQTVLRFSSCAFLDPPSFVGIIESFDFFHRTITVLCALSYFIHVVRSSMWVTIYCFNFCLLFKMKCYSDRHRKPQGVYSRAPGWFTRQSQWIASGTRPNDPNLLTAATRLCRWRHTTRLYDIRCRWLASEMGPSSNFPPYRQLCSPSLLYVRHEL